MEKLNLDSDLPPKGEIRRDVTDAPTPLVSERNGGQRGREADTGKDVHLYTIMLLFHSLPTCSLWRGNSALVRGHSSEI